MKKKIAACLFLLLIAVCLTSCGTKPKVTRAYLSESNHVIVEYSDGTKTDIGGLFQSKIVSSAVDENYHLILTFEDGKTEDAGYVGVELPLYTVTFVGVDGATLQASEVFKGKSAVAPEAPAVEGLVFTGWDVPFDNIQGDTVVTAVYDKAPAFTVTFTDGNGTVLKTESVLAGQAATAPSAPTRSGMIFESWDATFENISADLTVNAVFRTANTYTVTFLDYSGVYLGEATVTEGSTAKPPFTPTREGYTFYTWSDSVKKVKSDLTVKASYSITKTDNAFDLAAAVKDNTLTVTLAMKSEVCFSGLSGTITVPEGLTFVSAEDESGMTTTYNENTVSFVFSSEENVTKRKTLSVLTFTVDDDLDEVTLDTVISDIYSVESLQEVERTPIAHTVLGQTIRLK